ncbi:MAG: hypothetical protein L0Y64_03865, partial [Myxococcaceae bacterium]|nr:hypothetical protein [Myxococcaceae bacterium]
MQAKTKLLSAVVLTWGLAAQAAPTAPRLFPTDLPVNDETAPYAQRTQDQEGAVIIDEEPTRVAVVEPKERRGS